MNALDIIKAIRAGDLDEDISLVTEALTARQAARALSVRPGEKVRFNGNIKPKYLVGVLASVVKVNSKTVTCRIDDPATAGRFQGDVRVPVSLIEPVTA